MKQVEVSVKFIRKLEDVLDELIQIIDHDIDAIDDHTTGPARKLLNELSVLSKE